MRYPITIATVIRVATEATRAIHGLVSMVNANAERPARTESRQWLGQSANVSGHSGIIAMLLESPSGVGRTATVVEPLASGVFRPSQTHLISQRFFDAGDQTCPGNKLSMVVKPIAVSTRVSTRRG